MIGSLPYESGYGATIAGFTAIALTSTIAKASTITMDELPSQSLNGVSLNGVTFSTTDTDAIFGGLTFGNGAFVESSASYGRNAYDLTLDFSVATSFLNFGFALSETGSPGNDGVTVELFDSVSNSLGIFTALTSGLTPTYSYEEGLFSANVGGIAKAVISFGYLNGTSKSWGLDNIEYGVSVVPLPSALPLYGAGIAVMGFIGWRRKRNTINS